VAPRGCGRRGGGADRFYSICYVFQECLPSVCFTHGKLFAECVTNSTRRSSLCCHFFHRVNFAECNMGFGECFWHSAKRRNPVVTTTTIIFSTLLLYVSHIRIVTKVCTLSLFHYLTFCCCNVCTLLPNSIFYC